MLQRRYRHEDCYYSFFDGAAQRRAEFEVILMTNKNIACDGFTRLFFNMPFGFFGPELMATLFQPNPRSEV
ncbi:hypothetical protein TNCV_3266421 [Trichonephila clavipes]|nr:hypothetical protein TNCV_3266421 [Trichonephila clavipes]